MSVSSLPTRSVLIRQDVLNTYTELKQIKGLISNGITENTNQSINNRLQNVVDVHNENIKYINKIVVEHLEKHVNNCAQNPERQNQFYFAINQEITSLREVGFNCEEQSKKILSVIERFKKNMPADSNLMSDSLLVKVDSKVLSTINKPKLRTSIDEPKLRQKKEEEALAVLRQQAIEKEKQAVISQQEWQKTIMAQFAHAAAHCDITINYPELTAGSALGICCDPDWADKPIAFTKSENGWRGEVPKNKEWKCVIIQNGQVTQWENNENRLCDAQTKSLTLNNINF